jgi:CubicO group peptidase (beta-lactamase class C family)
MRTPVLSVVRAALGVTVAVPGAAGAQSPAGAAAATPAADPARLARLATAFPAIDSTMRAFAERRGVPGIAYGIVVDGRVVHRGTVGLRNLATRAPVDSASVFRIASMTKSFTALAVLKLRDEGRLALDDPAERHVPELRSLRYPTADSPKITVRHLLTHSAGFPEDNPWGDRQLAATPEELSRMLRRGIPFSTAPGTTFEYSNLGFAILGRVVANVSGVPYARYVQEQILRPLGMGVTTLEAAQVPASRLALGYRRQDGRWLEEAQLPDGAFGAMGGMLTSVDDLGRWVGFMLDAWPARDGPERGPVRRASVREMQQVARFAGATAARDTAAGAPALAAGGYGYGLGVSANCLFPALVSHSGGLPGFGSIMRWLPEHGVGIVALGNLTYTGWGAPTTRALELLARAGGLAPRAPRPAPVLAERRAQVARLVAGWSDALADSLAAMNLYLDESKARRRAAIDSLRAAAGGDCREEGPLVAENALRGAWRLRCRGGDLRVSITLAPTEPAGVQFLDVAPLRREERLGPAPACR